ncbi:MAG TPA: DMT family transporter [Rhabdaerophilum sp.]|nr:DMT family transporter [Rhabdaerophilum sp.]
MSIKEETPPAAPVGARAMTGAEWGMLGLLSLFWGGSFLFNGIAVREVPVFTIVAFRVLLGAAALHVMLRVAGIPLPLDGRSLTAYLGMAILNGSLPFCLIVFGQTRIASGLASILNATTPIFTMLLAHFALSGEQLDLRRTTGVLLGFAGVVVLFSGRSASGGEWLGLLACIGGAISYSFANIFGRLFIQGRAHPTALATGQLTFAALIMVPIALATDRPFSLPVPSGSAVLALVLLALVSTAAAYTLFFRILTRAGATNASLVTLLIPCSGILLGVIFLGEALAWQEILGFLVIAAGLLVIDGRIVGFFRARPKA